jgi:hypothetical protein
MLHGCFEFPAAAAAPTMLTTSRIRRQDVRAQHVVDMRFLGIASDGAVNRGRMLLDDLKKREMAVAV